MAARIDSGSSLRGLSSVTIAMSAPRAAISPISGRLPRSRSPPQPNTRINRPLTSGRSVARTFRARRAYGVIDENRRAEARAHALQPPWRALQFFQGREDARGLGPALDGEARRDERIGGLKGAGERQFDAMIDVGMTQAQARRQGVRLGAQQRDPVRPWRRRQRASTLSRAELRARAARHRCRRRTPRLDPVAAAYRTAASSRENSLRDRGDGRGDRARNW